MYAVNLEIGTAAGHPIDQGLRVGAQLPRLLEQRHDVLRRNIMADIVTGRENVTAAPAEVVYTTSDLCLQLVCRRVRHHLLHVDRAVVPLMVERQRGTVVHIGSIAGHQVYPGGNVYCGTKHAVRGITGSLRLDLQGTGVRVCSVDPGMVETEFSEVRFHGDRERAAAVYRGTRPLTAVDVAEVVLFAASRPDHVDLAEVLLLPTDQASATSVHRRE